MDVVWISLEGRNYNHIFWCSETNTLGIFELFLFKKGARDHNYVATGLAGRRRATEIMWEK